MKTMHVSHSLTRSLAHRKPAVSGSVGKRVGGKAIAIVAMLLLLAPALIIAQALKGAGVTSSTVTPTNSFVAVSRTSTVFDITAHNSGGSDLYLVVFDATSLPANGAVPALPAVKIPTGKSGGYTWNVAGRRFANGVVAATSTTGAALTNSSAVFSIDVTWNPFP